MTQGRAFSHSILSVIFRDVRLVGGLSVTVRLVGGLSVAVRYSCVGVETQGRVLAPLACIVYKGELPYGNGRPRIHTKG